MAKLAETSQALIAAILFVMNILKLTKEYLWAFFYGLFFNRYFQNYTQKSNLYSILILKTWRTILIFTLFINPVLNKF